MPFMVAFHDAGVLDEARARSTVGHFPHLRLVSLAADADVDALPAHLRARVVTDPSAAATAALYPQVAATDILTWDQVADAYNRWIDEQYLTANALLSAFTPEGLYPLGFAAEPIDSGKNRGTAAFIERHAPGGADLNLGAVRAPVHVQLGA